MYSSTPHAPRTFHEAKAISQIQPYHVMKNEVTLFISMTLFQLLLKGNVSQNSYPSLRWTCRPPICMWATSVQNLCYQDRYLAIYSFGWDLLQMIAKTLLLQARKSDECLIWFYLHLKKLTARKSFYLENIPVSNYQFHREWESRILS